MINKTIIIAKIFPQLFEKIKTGEKIFEVRAPYASQCQFIQYLDASSGDYLGTYRVNGCFGISKHDVNAPRLAGLTISEFDKMFEDVPDSRNLQVYSLGERVVSLEQLTRYLNVEFTKEVKEQQ